MYNGVINVFKEVGFTSFDVVAKLRGILRQRKIGHTGTLDPDATGVLLICLGNATRLCDLITSRNKEYVVDFELGYTTDTLDHTGRVLTRSVFLPDEEQIRKSVAKFSKDHMQIPPMYSALKVNGKKLVNLAREGVEIERKPRPVQIFEVEILRICPPIVTLRVKCGKGTYIRTLCDDIGRDLGCGATMTALTRTQVSGFRAEDALRLSEVETLHQRGELRQYLLPCDSFFTHCPAMHAGASADKYIYNGNKLDLHHFNEKVMEYRSKDGEEKPLYRVYDHQNNFCGIYEWIDKEQVFKPFQLFLEAK